MVRTTPKEATEWLRTLLASPEAPSMMFWGPPGIGKSSIVAQAARSRGLAVIQLELAVLPPQELMGLPYVDNGRSQYAVPPFWPEVESGVLILEDLPHAAPVGPERESAAVGAGTPKKESHAQWRLTGVDRSWRSSTRIIAR